jgi:hypothetical protein
VVAAVIVAVAAFLIAKPGDDDEDSGGTSGQAVQTETSKTGGQGANGQAAPGPKLEEIVLRGGKPEGGVRSIRVTKNDSVRLVVSSDAEDLVHLHGYDIEKKVAPGKPAQFQFKADIEGVFEIESHEAEEAGREPLLARLVVEP